MSRRGRHSRHQHPGPAHPGGPAPERQAGAADTRPGDSRTVTPVDTMAPAVTGIEAAERWPVPERSQAPAAEPPRMAPPVEPETRPSAPHVEPVLVAVAEPRMAADGPDGRPTCTTAQLRRFIKSRPWVPMHELRRRFGIWGGDDDVSPARVGNRMLFIGLPAAESAMIAELLAGGDVGYELSLDPVTPIVVGVYPMRPVPRS